MWLRNQICVRMSLLCSFFYAAKVFTPRLYSGLYEGHRNICQNATENNLLAFVHRIGRMVVKRTLSQPFN